MDRRRWWIRGRGKNESSLWAIKQSISGILCSRCREIKTIGWILNTKNNGLPYYLHDGYFICSECVREPEVARGLENDTNSLTKKILEENCSKYGTRYNPSSDWYYTCRHCLADRLLVTRKWDKCPTCDGSGKMSYTQEHDSGLINSVITLGLSFLIMDVILGGVLCKDCKGSGHIGVYLNDGELPFKFSDASDLLL